VPALLFDESTATTGFELQRKAEIKQPEAALALFMKLCLTTTLQAHQLNRTAALAGFHFDTPPHTALVWALPAHTLLALSADWLREPNTCSLCLVPLMHAHSAW
jgi:hypothetical protein